MNTENVITKEIETKYKDKLFRIIFGKDDEKSKQWRLELYNALSGKKHTNPDDIELTTIENVLYITMKNDLSFLVNFLGLSRKQLGARLANDGRY